MGLYFLVDGLLNERCSQIPGRGVLLEQDYVCYAKYGILNIEEPTKSR
jgi:hypothetical protein